MNSPRFRRSMNPLMAIGFLLLIAASLLHFLVGRHLMPDNDLTDFLQGLLYGLCFASLLFGIRRNSRSKPDTSCRG